MASQLPMAGHIPETKYLRQLHPHPYDGLRGKYRFVTHDSIKARFVDMSSILVHDPAIRPTPWRRAVESDLTDTTANEGSHGGLQLLAPFEQDGGQPEFYAGFVDIKRSNPLVDLPDELKQALGGGDVYAGPCTYIYGDCKGEGGPSPGLKLDRKNRGGWAFHNEVRTMRKALRVFLSILPFILLHSND